MTDQETDPSLPPKVHAILVSLRSSSLPPLPSLIQISPVSHSHSHSHSPAPPSSDKVVPSTASLPILAIPSVRIFSSGPSFLVDVQLVLPADLTLKEANEVEQTVREALVAQLGKSRVREVVIRMRGAEEKEV